MCEVIHLPLLPQHGRYLLAFIKKQNDDQDFALQVLSKAHRSIGVEEKKASLRHEDGELLQRVFTKPFTNGPGTVRREVKEQQQRALTLICSDDAITAAMASRLTGVRVDNLKKRFLRKQKIE